MKWIYITKFGSLLYYKMDKAFYLPPVKQIQEMCNMGYEASALTYMDFPTQHWSRIRTNNTIERLNRETKRRTKGIDDSLTDKVL